MGTQNGVSHDVINVKLFLDIDKNLQKVIQGTVKLQQDNLEKAPDTEECGIKNPQSREEIIFLYFADCIQRKTPPIPPECLGNYPH